MKGEGLPHMTSKLRLFGHSEEDIRVTLYRDHAGWCPYCQKLWMMFELKQIPYRIERINMRSYGEKPASFLKKVPSGLLPVVELDGEIITESLVIMQILESTFPDNCMLPEDGFDRANELLRLERKLFSDWCGLVFRPGMPGPFGGGARKQFEETLDAVDAAWGNGGALVPGRRYPVHRGPAVRQPHRTHERVVPVLERHAAPRNRALGQPRALVPRVRGAPMLPRV